MVNMQRPTITEKLYINYFWHQALKNEDISNSFYKYISIKPIDILCSPNKESMIWKNNNITIPNIVNHNVEL